MRDGGEAARRETTAVRDGLRATADDLLPLVIEGLRLTIGERRLLDGISLRINGPGITVVMGPNGAGKSLLMRCLHGLISPSAGRISWGGAVLDDDIRRRQAMVFQRPVLLRRSVLANIQFAQRAQNIVDTPGGVDEAVRLLEATRLSALADQPARKLSGGEQQRLTLARALATRPDVLFLDEPTASLDPASTRIIEDLVLAASRRGVKVIFVTHNVHQAERLADEILFLADGRLCEQRDAAGFFAAPQSPQADAYLSGRLPEV